jgi:hypothetical protein
MRSCRWGILVFVVSAVLTEAQQKVDLPKPLRAAAQSATNDISTRLPVKRVVLYKNGIGYFEHSAVVRGNQELAIDFTTAQLNDVLKSLTVVDLGEGRISNVRYNSIAPLDERLKALRLPFGETVTRSDFLSALRGARVEVRSKGETTTTGRLLSVEQEDRTNDSGVTNHVNLFSIVTDSGEMRNFELGPAVSVRVAEHDLNEEVGRYLNLVGSSRARDLRRMTISAGGTGERNIFVSYISEVPVWKSTYRIILSNKPNEKPLLQGWAIVDNTIGEDWKDVQLSLIAGAPQSFMQDISQPLYARRPVVALPQSAMLTPQTHEATINQEEKPEVRRDVAGRGSGFGFGSGVGAGGPVHNGGGSGALLMVPKRGLTDQMGMASKADRSGDGAKSWLSQDRQFERLEEYSKLEPAAESKDLGDYFEYNLKQAITIGKNQSALVPILQSRVEAEKVTLWTANANQAPLRALWIKNASGQTLDSGTFNIIEGDTFAGEGLIAIVHPDERRLLSYAADTAVRVTSQTEAKDQPVSHIRISKGVILVSREQRSKVKYTIHNADAQPRQVVVEHPLRDGWKLADGSKPEETAASHYRFRVPVDPSKTNELTVEEFHPEETTSQLSDLTDDQVQLFAIQNRVTPQMRSAFHQVLDQKNQIYFTQSDIHSREHELESITKDQARIRENMKALKGSAEEKALLVRYAKQLDSQEDRLNTLNRGSGACATNKLKSSRSSIRLCNRLHWMKTFEYAGLLPCSSGYSFKAAKARSIRCPESMAVLYLLLAF